MADKSGISWCDATWPVTTGCELVSPGCTRCYAMRQSATRLKHVPAYEGVAEMQNGHPAWTGRVNLLHERLDWPLRWQKPRKIFVADMSDLFWEAVTDDFIDRVFAVMAWAPQHTFQILTKRAERMRAYFADLGQRRYAIDAAMCEICMRQNGKLCGFGNDDCQLDGCWLPLDNVWLGTSVEDQRRADERIPALLDTPAAVRFLSCEPLLTPIDLRPYLHVPHAYCGGAGCDYCGEGYENPDPEIHWVIVGGESGPRYRPMDLDWARQLRDDCLDAGVAFFYKQAGGPRNETGRELDGVRWEQFPQEAAS